ncbi:MAG: hypothetical protein N4A72_08115 [Bacteroidales bacterium]|jgi:hypothetical protein|nr:hypothetical protein [Bacteroidales bacterium]
MKRYILKLSRLVLTLSFFIFLASCEKDELPDQKVTENQTLEVLSSSVNEGEGLLNSSTPCGTPMTVDFLAGQHILAGQIIVSNDDDYLYVTFTTSNGWVMGATHLFVGDMADLPVNKKGNPKIGHFPDKATHNPYVTEYTYVFDLSELNDCYVIAAHAEVYLLDDMGNPIQSETAWGEGTPFNESGSWAMYFSYCTQECQPCIIQPEVFDIFGGQTIPVGNLSVTNDEQNLYVTFNFTGDWYMGVTHLYVGTLQNLPTNNANTPIPGQFPYNVMHNPYVQTYTYIIPLASLPDCYIIAAHAEAHKLDDMGNPIQSETAWSFGVEFPNTNRWGWYSPYCTQVCP